MRSRLKRQLHYFDQLPTCRTTGCATYCKRTWHV